MRSRWAAIGAAVAVTIGAGGLVAAHASDSSPGSFVSITPCRVIDTRPGAVVGPRARPLDGAETYATAFVGAAGNCSIPPSATAVVLNLTAANPTDGSYLTVFPTGGSLPTASNLNHSASEAPVANSATIQIGAGGQLSFFNARGQVDLIVDVSGYYLPAGSRTQQLTFGSRAVAWNSSGTAPSTVNNCTTTASGVPFGVIPLNLPIGAAILSIQTVIWDSSSASSYTVALERQRTGATGIAVSGSPLLQTAGGGSSNVAVTDIATSSDALAVTATDSYWLEINLGTALTNAFCSATVTVTMP